jgi:hypothetical protein
MTGSALFNAGPGSRPRCEGVPGAVHVPSWLTTGQQRWITGRFEENSPRLTAARHGLSG